MIHPNFAKNGHRRKNDFAACANRIGYPAGRCEEIYPLAWRKPPAGAELLARRGAGAGHVGRKMGRDFYRPKPA
jgi:hypothetical protein